MRLVPKIARQHPLLIVKPLPLVSKAEHLSFRGLDTVLVRAEAPGKFALKHLALNKVEWQHRTPLMWPWSLTVNNLIGFLFPFLEIARVKHDTFPSGGSVAEWSKALDLGSSLYEGVGSNPTAITSFIFQPVS